jgi:hypothetical protein
MFEDIAAYTMILDCGCTITAGETYYSDMDGDTYCYGDMEDKLAQEMSLRG